MSEPTRGVIDSAAREQAITSNGSVLVQAPAGSGKTTLLAQRYLRLLALVDAPERILALTFTRRAAQEMRQRVLSALGAAALAECPDGMNPAHTWSLGVAAKRRMESIKCDMELQPSRLRIETIDAFNAWLANQLPITASVQVRRCASLTDVRPAYEEAARRALAHEGADPFGIAVDRVLELDDQRWRKLVELIAEMLPPAATAGCPASWPGGCRPASAIDPSQLSDVRRHFDEDLRLLVVRVLLRARELFGPEREARDHCHRSMQAAAQRLSETSPMAMWRESGAALEAEGNDIARWRSLATLLLTAEGTLRKRVTITEGFPPGCAEKPVMMDLLTELDRDPRMLDLLVELRTLPDPAYSDGAWARVREIAQVLVLAAAELDGVFREQGAVDFPAVSLAALRALGTAEAPTDLSLRIDYRLQHILVDEFQDTSSAQLALVRLLTAGWQKEDGRSIFCVGDPMQSIYGFRQARGQGLPRIGGGGYPGGGSRFEVQRLRSNFRSDPSVVEWINACFARLMPQSDDRNRGAIAFHASEAAVARSDEARSGQGSGERYGEGYGVKCAGFLDRGARIDLPSPR